MKIFYRFFDKFKIKFCRAYFCMGIGLNQLTPEYYRLITATVVDTKTKKKYVAIPR